MEEHQSISLPEGILAIPFFCQKLNCGNIQDFLLARFPQQARTLKRKSSEIPEGVCQFIPTHENKIQYLAFLRINIDSQKKEKSFFSAMSSLLGEIERLNILKVTFVKPEVPDFDFKEEIEHFKFKSREICAKEGGMQCFEKFSRTEFNLITQDRLSVEALFDLNPDKQSITSTI